jgi:hypothetical protein
LSRRFGVAGGHSIDHFGLVVDAVARLAGPSATHGVRIGYHF